MIKYLIYILLFPVGVIAQTITLTPIGDQDVSNIPVTVTQYQPGGTVGTISQLTSGIPSDRGQGTSTIFSTSNSDQGSVTINFPTGYAPSVGSNTYTTAKLHANAWMAFPTTTYNSYASSATAPNVPTLHFTSVNNGYTDNNMSHVSTETYTDASLGDVFRVRYEGSYKYNVQGINTKIDIYFPKNNPNHIIVVLRLFLADGSNIEQIGLSDGSSWIASNLISNANYASGQAWKIENNVLAGGSTTLPTQYTNSLGQVTFSNPNNYSYDVTIDVSSKTHTITDNHMNHYAFKRSSTISDWDYYIYNFNPSPSINRGDIQAGYLKWRNQTLCDKYVFSLSEKSTIESNPSTNYIQTYSPTQVRTFQNQNQFFIIGMGIPKTTINNLFKMN